MREVKGIQSKDRVQKHGEVFTPDSIVNDMLDLVDEELKPDASKVWEYVDTTYLEPACGDGNFLIRILDRKLGVAHENLPKEQWNLALIHALCSMYAVDIQLDNVIETRNRLTDLIINGTTTVLELEGKEKQGFHFYDYSESYENLKDIIKSILESNIVNGNCLTGKLGESNVSESTDDSVSDIIFNEYHWDADHENLTVVEKYLLSKQQIGGGITSDDVPYAKPYKITYKELSNLSSLKSAPETTDNDTYDDDF
jgi:hypothetical protein